MKDLDMNKTDMLAQKLKKAMQELGVADDLI
jgi:hypothetical protein